MGEALAGWSKGPCGWLKDKFGLSWQIVPDAIVALLSDADPVKAQRMMAAVLQMSNTDIAELRQAHEGVTA